MNPAERVRCNTMAHCLLVGRVFTPETRLQGSELLTVTTRTPCPWCVVISPGPLIRSTGHYVAMCSRKQSLNPPAERRIFLGKTRESRACTVDQQHPQISVAALADAQQPRFSTCRRLTRYQSQPSCQVTGV